jgi:hypothetical protein
MQRERNNAINPSNRANSSSNNLLVRRAALADVVNEKLSHQETEFYYREAIPTNQHEELR